MGLASGHGTVPTVTVEDETELSGGCATGICMTCCMHLLGVSRRWLSTCTWACRSLVTPSGCSTACAATSRFCSRCRPAPRSRRAVMVASLPSAVDLQAFPRAGLPRFLAARDGMDARLMDSTTRRLVPAREPLAALLGSAPTRTRARVRRWRWIGCGRSPPPTALSVSTRWRRSTGLDQLVVNLTDRFLAPEWLAVNQEG